MVLNFVDVFILAGTKPTCYASLLYARISYQLGKQLRESGVLLRVDGCL